MFTALLFLFVLKDCAGFLKETNESLNFNDSTQSLGIEPVSYDYFDWRDRGVVTPVKDQGSCNACWAFAVVACIESHLQIYLKRKMILSEQFLIDCDDEQKGCNAGSLVKAYANIVSKFGGVLQDRDYYPYANGKYNCRWQPPSEDWTGRWQPSRAIPVPVIGFSRVRSDEKAMVDAVKNHGPLSVAINSERMGIYMNASYIDEPTNEECDPKRLNHAVLIVGYNTHVTPQGKKTPYWIIKNSWGTEFGDNGYYYLVRGRNACGIASDVSYAFVN